MLVMVEVGEAGFWVFWKSSQQGLLENYYI